MFARLNSQRGGWPEGKESLNLGWLTKLYSSYRAERGRARLFLGEKKIRRSSLQTFYEFICDPSTRISKVNKIQAR